MSIRSRLVSSTSTSATSGERSRRSPRVLITSWPSRGSATASRTPAPTRSADSKLGERLQDELTPSDSWVWDDKPRLANPAIAEQEDVDVDDARSPVPGRRASTLALDSFCSSEKATRRAVPFRFDHLVEESRLLCHTPGLGLHDAALTQDAHSVLTQPPSCGALVARASTQVRTQAEIDDRQSLDQCPGR